MHGNFPHLFFNMFALWMFGKVLENVWGGKKFLIYYMITGLGAASIHLGVSQYEIMSLQAQISSNDLNTILNEGGNILAGGQNYTNPIMGKLNLLIHTPTVGASGAVFGVLLAFGMLFPNALLYIYFAIPVKDQDQIVKFLMGSKQSRFPNRAFIHFTFTDDHIGFLFTRVLFGC